MFGHDCVMVTGGCGAMGSVLLNDLLEKYPETRFVNLDKLTYCGKAENIHIVPNYKLYKGDICDADIVTHILRTEKPAILIHLAAETHVDTSFGNSIQFTVTNVLGTHTLLECVKQYGNLKLFLHMSTDEVYGSVGIDDCLTEQAAFAPSNPYAATKVGAEMICHSYKHSFNLPIIIMRCNNIISPFQNVEKLIPKSIDCIRKGQKVPVHGDGKSLRTFIDARDVATALEVVIDTYFRDLHNAAWIFNIGTRDAHEFTVFDVVRAVAKHLINNDERTNEFEVKDYVEFVDDRPFQDKRYCIDSSLIRTLGWCEKYTFLDSLEYVIDRA